jgi:large conductance mechanosensitive channel
MLKDFRAFILRGNVVDLAVGVVIGAAFGTIVTAIVTGLINPLVSFTPSGSLENVKACIGGYITKAGKPHYEPCLHAFKYGSVLSAILSFVIIAAVVFFFVVKPVNHLTEKFKADKPVEKPMRDCPECESSIPINAKRCAFCTAEVPAVT